MLTLREAMDRVYLGFFQQPMHFKKPIEKSMFCNKKTCFASKLGVFPPHGSVQ